MRRLIALVSVIGSLLSANSRGAADFNGDGFNDLVIATPYEAVLGVEIVGAVHVIYGTALFSANPLENYFTPYSLEMPGILTPYMLFGAPSVTGDFDADGFSDLAIGAPGATVSGHFGAGCVFVLYGSPVGLLKERLQIWSQDSKGIKDAVEGTTSLAAKSVEAFGSNLAVGDFDADGRDDLAISCEGESVKVGGVDTYRGGAVHALYGSKKGLAAKRNRMFTRETPGIPGTATNDDRFGSELEAGDFNGDGADDLAVAIFGADEVVDFSGAVLLIYGKAKVGLTSQNARELTEAGLGHVTNSTGGGFGITLAAGDINGDDRDDLVIGSPWLTRNNGANAGGVYVLLGTANGISPTGSALLDEQTPNVPGTAQAGDQFGSSLGFGDFNGDGYADLMIGAPSDDDGAVANSGMVFVLPGSALGLSPFGILGLHEGTSGMPGQAQFGDRFGMFVLGTDLNGDGADELVVSAVGETIAGESGAGAVIVCFGQMFVGVTTANSFQFDEDIGSVADFAEKSDWFGFVLAG